jgi:NADPH:quinone reductase-like Zn-dependent oxidoreductase
MSNSSSGAPITRRTLLGASAIAAALPVIATSTKVFAASETQQHQAGTIKAAIIKSAGKPIKPNISISNDWPAPSVGAGQARIRTLASALNHLDLFIAWGARQLPWVCGSDACGEVLEVGEGVDKAWLGKRVILNARILQQSAHLPAVRPPEFGQAQFIGLDLPGTHAEQFVAPIENLLEIDADIDPVAAAAFPLTYLTAWRMLTSRASISPEQTVLLTGIGGGVAQASLDICRHIGCESIVTSRADSKLKRARERGAQHTIHDQGQDWSRQVMEITRQRGVDVCADSVAKAVHERCLKSLATGGTYVTCGSTSGADITTDNNLIFLRQISYLGSSMGSMQELRQVTSLFRRGVLQPEIDMVFEANQIGEAFARLESSEQLGKVVVRWS